ncbi:protein disulfide-isomerase TMX3-like [Diabrotica virgifera virgifera]|uniref:Protein disulfide-isomerase TMX3-like n=1 Tax=Diabrotica virgifera virgifera TaxID=50390 RepID=A0A6P7GZE3_DIAVI|nr:protein disulfide-isomerase TMX3-like [Diabrotica virgifera virgifera]
MHIFRLVLLIKCIIVVSPSSKWILELGDNFIDVRKDGGYWLVKFYTPWCGHCKRLEPIWAHVVQALKNTHIRVGKVDCTIFPNVGKSFDITTYPTIKLIKAEEDFTFEGEKITDEIISFAIRLAGPPVQQVTRPESLINIKNMNQLFFMYVGERDGLLWNTFYDVASKFQAHAFYYSATEEIANKHVDIHTLPAVFVHKENSHYFYSVGEGNNQIEADHINSSMHKWINEERFETFPKITETNINEILRTEKFIVLVVVEENKLLQIPKDMLDFRNLVESIARKNRDKYHDSFQFGWSTSHELANNIVMQIVALPYLIVLNSTTLHHHVPEDDPTEMTVDAIELFLEKVINQTATVYGGNDLAVRMYRSYFKARTTLSDRWRGNPVLTTVLLGLPLGFLSFILYSCCCANILDADEDEEEELLHEKKD